MMRHNSRGPMMAPEIQELELELQLLKRKRMLLQQQQDMLIGSANRERQHDYNFDPSSQYNQQQPQEFNFSQLYDDRVSGSGNRDRQFGQKRRAPEPWEGSALAKRFQGSKGKPKNAPGPRSNQGFGSNRRGFNDFRQRSDDQRQRPLRNDARPNDNFSRQGSSVNKGFQRDFRPSKVTKPKTRNRPHKLDSYSQGERKKFIGDTLMTIDENTIVLSSDTPPTPTQSGRLELAMGNILKDLRQDFGTKESYIEIFQTDSLLKVVKQTLRDRIRSVMLGHPVVHMKVIIAKYREKYPRETDQEIIDTAMEVATLTRRHSKLAFKLVESEVPESYFKRNFGKLLDLKLTEMLKKLEELYTEDNVQDLQTIIDSQIQAASSEDKEKYDPAEAFQTSNQSETENSVDKIDSYDGDKTDKSGDEVIKTDNDSVIEANESGTVNESEALVDESKDSVNETDKNDAKSEQEEKSEKNDTSAETEEISESDDQYLKVWKIYNQRYFKAEFYERIMNQYLKYKLPRLLPMYKENIFKILDLDKQYKTTKAAIIQRLGTKLAKENPNVEFKSKVSHEGRLPVNHYVKIIGRPGLPKRRVMSKFLEDFKPLTIKKHKTVNNLLFVGFHVKEDFDKILNADGTVLGNVTLTIAVSEWKNPKTSGESSNTPPENIESTNTKEEEKSLINEELDTQITELLTSVDEEESAVKTEGESTDNKENGEESDTQKEEKTVPKIEEAGENDTKEKNETAVIENTVAENVASEQVDTIKIDSKKVAAATPTRSSTRLASGTPSGITTRRTSKMS